MKEFIMEIPGAATPGFCQHLIDKYESDDRKEPARIGPDGIVDKNIRTSINLEMNRIPDWNWEYEEVKKMLFSHIVKYTDEIHIKKLHGMFIGGYDSSYTMMKYEPGPVGYNWHNDFLFDDFSDNVGVRTVTWLFYLNEVDGGDTEFIDGTRIKCDTGKLVLFPASWTFVHRGMPVISGVKYLCGGWIYSRWNAK